ncbi:MAG TPA: Gfo/Idh/MocA family oxidoreductase [Acidobacteriota bacterium]|nr:Gfo/Idh/MocA family oxidoreductase [Acidobacteriota bacterium]
MSVGKEGQSKVRQNGGRMTRRDFVAAGAAAMIVPRHVLGGTGYVPPSEMVNIALIGAGGQGTVNLKALFEEPDARVIAVADPSETTDVRKFYYGFIAGRLPTLQLIKDTYVEQNRTDFKGCTGYVDYREMLEKEKDIDAVLVATPDHVHAVATVAAMKLGKHVYCEKPLCHSIEEVRKVTEVARETKVATQMGNHGHSGEGIRLTCEWIWDGAIGPVREVHSWAGVKPWTDMTTVPKETPPVPEGLNWDLWLGPAAYRPYHPAYAPVTWRCWFDFGTGYLGDFACHHLDPAFWALKLGYPESVEATCYNRGEATFPHASIVYFNFPARGDMPPVKVVWYDGGLGPETPEELDLGRKLNQQEHGILFVGDKGKILAGGWGGTPRLIPETAMRQYKRPKPTLRRVKGHHRDWLDACKGGEAASANFEAMAPMVEAILLGSIALQVDGKLRWDSAQQKFTNNDKANELVNPPYREGWTL